MNKAEIEDKAGVQAFNNFNSGNHPLCPIGLSEEGDDHFWHEYYQCLSNLATDKTISDSLDEECEQYYHNQIKGYDILKFGIDKDKDKDRCILVDALCGLAKDDYGTDTGHGLNVIISIMA